MFSGSSKMYMPMAHSGMEMVPGEYEINCSATYVHKNGRLSKLWELFKYNIRKHMVDYLKQVGVIKPKFKLVTEYKPMMVEVDFDRIAQEILKCERAVRSIYNQEVEMIVIGMEEYYHLNHTISMRFPEGYMFSCIENSKRLELVGIPVKIVPYFKGVLPIPRD